MQGIEPEFKTRESEWRVCSHTWRSKKTLKHMETSMLSLLLLFVINSTPTLRNSMDYSPPGSSVQGFSRQEYWSGLPCPPPGDLPNPEIEPTYPASAALQADSLATKPPGKPPNNLSLTYYLLKHPVPKYSLVVSY